MTRLVETAQDQRLSEFEESVTLEVPSRHEAERRRRRNWMVAGGVAILIVVIGLAASAVRLRDQTPAKAAPGSIDWKLSVFSHNRIVFRPSLAIFPPSALRKSSLRSAS